MDPAIIRKSSDQGITTATINIQDYARKNDDEEKELRRSNDLDIQRYSNPDIQKSRYGKFPRLYGSRDKMDPVIQISSDPEISTTTRKICDYARKTDENELHLSNDLDTKRSSKPEIQKSIDHKIPKFNRSRDSMDPANNHKSSDSEMSTATIKILNCTRKSDEKDLQRSSNLDMQRSSNPEIYKSRY